MNMQLTLIKILKQRKIEKEPTLVASYGNRVSSNFKLYAAVNSAASPSGIGKTIS